jgi:PAS domain S-box-containing protein
MTRPFEEIATAAGDVAGGNWTRHVELRGKGEARVMAAAFNEMSASLRHWSDEAHDKSRRLQAAYERFHSVTESARDAIVSTDGQGTITFWNRSAAAIFRCPEEQALGQPFTRFMAGPDRAFFDAAVAPLLAGGAGPGTGGVIEISANGLDDEPFPAEIALSVSTSEGGPAIIAVVRDITERKRAEAVLEQRNEELRQAQKMEALGRLAGGVAHDFNNLLTAMRGYGEILKDALTGDEKRSGYAAQILRAADSAAALTRQLLAVSRRQKLAPETLALDRIVRSMEQILRRVIGEDVTLASASEPALGLVRADPGQIEQVLMNLAVNARDAMPGGGQIHITLSNVVVDDSAGRAHDGLAAGAYVQLAVVDTGCGMDEDTARHIFEPFFTTKGVGQGTGLGLSTVYGIVQQSGGRVEVDTAPGQGTTFRVLLPCVDAEETTVEAQPIARRAGAASETVLLVEDDARVRGFVSNVLERQGYRVLEADGAPAALDVLSQHPAAIHLLLTDVVMPGMNGRELAERVTGVRPSTRVLFMSGYSNDAVLLRGVSAHDGHFVQKPFTIDVLSTKIREAMASP